MGFRSPIRLARKLQGCADPVNIVEAEIWLNLGNVFVHYKLGF